MCIRDRVRLASLAGTGAFWAAVGRSAAAILGGFVLSLSLIHISFEVAAQDLGMGSTYLGPTGSQIGVKESIADTARVLGRMYDGIEYRGFGQDLSLIHI